MKLKIEAFRGVNQLTELKFKNNCDLTIIYGENGSGKTTISDALEFLFHGSSGSLELKSLDGKGKIPALVHTQRKNTDLLVEWEDTTGSRKSTLSGSKPVYTGELTTRLKTLRRDLIARLLDDTPANRFKHIQNFVSLPSLEREEDQLAAFIKENETQQQSHEEIASRRTDELQTLYDEACKNITAPPELKTWAEELIAELDDTQEENLEILKDLQHELKCLRSDFTPLKDSLDALRAAEGELSEEEEKLSAMAAQDTGHLAEALTLLQDTHTILAHEDLSACPVCDTPHTSTELRGKVDAKLGHLQGFADQSKIVAEARARRDRLLAITETLRNKLFEVIELFHATYTAAVESEQWELPTLAASLDTPAEAEHLNKEWLDLFSQEEPSLTPLNDWVDKQVETIQLRNTLKDRVKTLTEEIAEATSEFESLAAIIAKAKTILGILRSERTGYANEVLASISGEFARLYHSIHPGENIEKIALYLHETKKGSAMIGGELHGKEDISPVACLSESHLDTLGLCLFLALEKIEDPGNTILYLDDAIASVDEAHMSRLYEMIVAEASHLKHVIITSHYQPLRFKFKWGQLTKQSVDFIELGPWSLDRGISIGRGPASEIKLLKQHLDEQADAQIIASKAGIVLEKIFDFLTGIYRCKLPRSPGPEQRWTLGDYCSGLYASKQKLLKALECQHVEEVENEDGTITRNTVSTIPLAPLIDTILKQLETRNALGAHYKDMAGQFNDITEATSLGEATMALVDALCDEKLQLPDTDTNGRCWTNKGKNVTRHLYPLTQPR